MIRFWRARDVRIPLLRPLVMGVVNVTPDSFSDGGLLDSTEDAVAHANRLTEAGADVIDVGGESTRPGAAPVDADEEISRVVGVVRRLAEVGVLVSIDTTKPAVASAAIEAGAVIVNDVSGLGDPEMISVAEAHQAGVVVMHMQGNPRTMQNDPRYVDVVADIAAFLRARTATAVAAGIDPESVVVDPGIGFGKTMAHNLALLNRLGALREIGYPLLVGASRKRFLGEITGHDSPIDRDMASAVAAATAVMRGADIIRTHDVVSTLEAVKVAWAIVREEGAQWAPVVPERVGR
jgi:dihydropteroate synthase